MAVRRTLVPIALLAAVTAGQFAGSCLAQTQAELSGPQPASSTADAYKLSGPLPEVQAPAGLLPAAPFNAVNSQLPASPPSWQLLNQARALLEQNQPAAALPLIRSFIAARPLEPEGYFWEGVAFDNLQQLQNALLSYGHGIEQVLRAGMDSAELRMNAANDLLKLKHLDPAIDQYKRAAVIDPTLPIVQLNLGRALIEKNDIEGALKCFQRCEDLRFTPFQLSYYRAKAFQKIGRHEDAKVQVEKALSQLSMNSQASARLRQEFAQLLNTR